MIRTVGFAYAGARIQARYGKLVTASQWERLQRLGTPTAFLQAARDTALRPWLAQVDPAAGAHALESQLRGLFRRRVSELAGWAPPAWRPAVAWVEVLPDLPAIAHRLRGGAAAWMEADERLAPLVRGGEGAELPPELRGLRDAVAARQSVTAAWLARFRALWPAATPAERRGLEQLLALLQDTLEAAATDAPAALAALQRPLRKLFRRSTRAPAGLFAYLALTWMEFGAVRGALLRRRLGLPLEEAA